MTKSVHTNANLYAPLRLRAIAGECAGMTWALDEHPFTIGRGTGCHVRLDNEHVSRRHCEIQFESGVPVLYDRQERNSTLLNGRPVKQSVLRPGDVISIFDNRFVIETDPGTDQTIEEAPDPTPMTAPLSDALHLQSAFDKRRHAGDVAVDVGDACSRAVRPIIGILVRVVHGR